MRKHLLLLLSPNNRWYLLLLLTLTLHGLACKDSNQTAETNNTVYIRLASEPERLHPLLTEESNAQQIVAHIFQSLLDFDPQTLALQPVLAQQLPQVQLVDTGAMKGSMMYQFDIHPKAHWDNGTPVTVADVLFSFKSIFSLRAGSDNLKTSVDFLTDIRFDSLAGRRCTFVCNKKFVNAAAAIGTIPILPEYIYDATKQLRPYNFATLANRRDSVTIQRIFADSALQRFARTFNQPLFSRQPQGVIGSGAYRLAAWTMGQSIVLERKKNWWADSLATDNPMFDALPDVLHYRIVSDEAAVVSMMKDGKLDAVNKLSPKNFSDMGKDSALKLRYRFTAAPTLNYSYVGFNMHDARFADKRTRRAFAHLLDVPMIIKTVMNGMADTCVVPIAPTRSYYEQRLPVVRFDTAKAKTLLAQAGWKDSDGDGTIDKMIGGKKTPFIVRFVFVNNLLQKNLALMFQQNAQKVGIQTTLVGIEASAFMQAMKKRDMDLFLSGAVPPPVADDPKELWASSSDTPDGGNRTGFRNAAADVLMEQIRSELDSTRRDALYRKFQVLIYDEQPAIFLFNPKERIVTNLRFEVPITKRRPGFAERLFRLKKK